MRTTTLKSLLAFAVIATAVSMSSCMLPLLDSDQLTGTPELFATTSRAVVSLVNAGFEDQSPQHDGWVALSGDTLAGYTAASQRTGSYGVKLVDTSRSVSQTVTGLSPNTAYVFKAWMAVGGRLGVTGYGGSTIYSSTATSSSFVQFSVNFTTGASSTSATIFAEGAGAANGIVDDVTLDSASTPSPSPSPSPGGSQVTLTNAGFEDQSPQHDGWGYLSGDSLAGYTAASQRSGAYGVKLVDASRSVTQTVSGLTANTTYTLKAWLKIGGRIGVMSFGGTTVYGSTATSSTFSQFSVNFTTGASNTSAVIFAEGAGASNGIVDDFTLESAGGGGGSAPGTPTNFAAGTATSSTIVLTWTAVSGAENYTVSRSTSSGGTYTDVHTVAATTVTNAALQPGTTYYYKIKANNAYGSSALSSYISKTTLAASTVPINNPGLRNADGSAHATPTPWVVTGGTITISAPDSSDSTDETALIQNAIDTAAAANPTKEVYLTNGTYNLNSFSGTNVHLLGKTKVNIRGQSQSGVILKSNQSSSTSLAGIKFSGVNNLVMENMTFTNTCAYTNPTDLAEAAPPAYGLTYVVWTIHDGTNPSYNITIRNVTVEKFRKMAFRIDKGSRDVVVKSCTAKNAIGVGGGGAGYAYTIQGSGHAEATSNPFLGTLDDSYFNVLDSCATTGPYVRHAVIIQYWTHNNLVTNCNFDSTRYDSIDLHGEDEYANEIANNTTTNCSNGSGIALGNSAAGHDNTGTDNWIRNNIVENCVRGVTIEYGTKRTTVESNTIRNTTKSSASGIVLGYAIETTVINNTISNNSGSGYKAVYLFDNAAEGTQPGGGLKNSNITGNTVTSSGTAFTDGATLDSGNTIQSSW